MTGAVELLDDVDVALVRARALVELIEDKRDGMSAELSGAVDALLEGLRAQLTVADGRIEELHRVANGTPTAAPAIAAKVARRKVRK